MTSPADKEVERLPQFFRDAMTVQELKTALYALNAMKSASTMSTRPNAAIKKWAKGNMTPAIRACMIKMADVGEANAHGVGLGKLMRHFLQLIDS